MNDTKENILTTALRLFAQDGYEAVSVSKIAGELGMTKGALYKHYKSKRDIFDCIFDRICQLDAERFRRAGVSVQDFDGTAEPFRETSVKSVTAYMEAQFCYWTEDETACNFRRMLTVEQYRNPETAGLYQKVMGSGPVGFIEIVFRAMMEQGTWKKGDAKQMAVEFYAPFYLCLSLSDAASAPGERKEIARLFTSHMDRFVERYAAGQA